MKIERILSFKQNNKETLGMILSNKFDLMYKGEAAITRKEWDSLIDDIIKWHEFEIKKDIK